MIRQPVLSIATAVAAATVTTASFAATTVTINSAPTVGLAGYTTYTVGINTDEGVVSAIDAAFTAGTMNQINPLGNPTIFQDVNGFFGFVGADVSQDSQFLFNSSGLTIAPGTASESGTGLAAAFTGFAPFASGNFAQIVLPTGVIASFDFDLAVDPDIGNGTPNDAFSRVLTGSIPVPEPASLVLLGLGGTAMIGRRRRA